MSVVSSPPSGPHTESISVGGVRAIGFNDFLNNAINKTSQERFFVYDSKRANCQIWISDLLTHNGLMSSSINSWVSQNMESVFKGLGFLETVNRGITDVASHADTLLYGQGANKHPRFQPLRSPV